MILDEKHAAVSSYTSFSEVVDEACGKLIDRQVKYSIKRIQKMDEFLADMEQELDDFLFLKDRKQ